MSAEPAQETFNDAAAMVGTPEPSAVVPGDRRRRVRREPDAERALEAPQASEETRRWFPSSGSYLLGSVLLSILAGFAVSRSWPGNANFAALCLAILGLLAIQPVRAWAQSKGTLEPLLGTLATIALPLGLFGFGMTNWAIAGSLSWEAAFVAMLGVGTIAAAHVRKRPQMIFATALAIWCWPVVAMGSLIGAAGLVISAVLAARVTVEQLREEEADEQVEEARLRAQARARGILRDYERTGQGWFWEIDRRGLLTYVSEPVADMLGRDAERMIGQPLAILFDQRSKEQAGESDLQSHLASKTEFHELPLRAAIDGERWWSVSGRPIHDERGTFLGFRGSGTELTESRRYQKEADRLARYDPLTGLANRRQMGELIEKSLMSAGADGNSCSIMLLDLDRFKQVNDTMGHPAGDELLRQVARRLEETVGSLGEVGRLGGDEFQVLIPGGVGQSTLTALASNIIETVSRPYDIERRMVSIGVSIGIACAPEHGTTSKDLTRNADLALYAAKEGGRGCYHYYASSLHSAAEERADLERDLRRAVQEGELQLHYQPVIQTASERICGFEALLRWQHPEKGWVSPAKFVSRAEDAGLIQQIGEWAIRTACQDAARWPDDVRVAVNVSATQLANAHLPVVVANALASAGLDPSRLELEVTENVFLKQDETIDATFAALKKIGVRLALDDFGTGYSSLGYLDRADFDKIKIDRSFVKGATRKDSRNAAIIASITGLAQALGMDTVAEGVENAQELEIVRMHGCSQVQGFIYSRPLDADAATERLRTGLAAVTVSGKVGRQPRQSTLQQVTLHHEGQTYHATVRNISQGGALIEGLWNVPEGTVFTIVVSETETAEATVKWSSDNRMGVELGHIVKVGNDERGRKVA